MAVTKSANGTVNRIANAVPATMKPEIITFKLIGISPLLQNNPAEFIGKAEDSKITAGKKVYKDEEEARLRTYRVGDDFGHPTESVIRAMTQAVKGKKFGKMFATAAIRGSVFVVEPFCIIEDAKGKPMQKYEIDRRSVVVGTARILRCRPVWKDWTMRVALEVDTAIISASNVLDALSLAGRTVGIGDFRPQVGGGFGRFSAQIP